MGFEFVKQPNGALAVWNTTADDFSSFNIETMAEALNYCINFYQMDGLRALAKIKRDLAADPEGKEWGRSINFLREGKGLASAADSAKWFGYMTDVEPFEFSEDEFYKYLVFNALKTRYNRSRIIIPTSYIEIDGEEASAIVILYWLRDLYGVEHA